MNGKSEPTSEPVAAVVAATPKSAASSWNIPENIDPKPAAAAVRRRYADYFPVRWDRRVL